MVTSSSLSKLENILGTGLDALLASKTLIPQSEEISYSKDILFPFLKKEIKNHIIDTSGMLSVANPLYAFFEQPIAGAGRLESLNFRYEGTKLAILGVAYAYNLGRDKFNQVLDWTFVSENKNVWARDHIYSSIFGSGFCYWIYSSLPINSETFSSLMIFGTGVSTFAGGPIGVGIDIFREILKNKEPIKPRISVPPTEPKTRMQKLLYPIKQRNHNWYLKHIKDQPIEKRIKEAGKILLASTLITGSLIMAVPDDYKGVNIPELIKTEIEYIKN